jgi:hypothetical protein
MFSMWIYSTKLSPGYSIHHPIITYIFSYNTGQKSSVVWDRCKWFKTRSNKSQQRFGKIKVIQAESIVGFHLSLYLHREDINPKINISDLFRLCVCKAEFLNQFKKTLALLPNHPLNSRWGLQDNHALRMISFSKLWILYNFLSAQWLQEHTEISKTRQFSIIKQKNSFVQSSILGWKSQFIWKNSPEIPKHGKIHILFIIMDVISKVSSAFKRE